jgi:hypothetical protein
MEGKEREWNGMGGKERRGRKGEGKGWTPLGPGPPPQNFWARTATVLVVVSKSS